MFIHNNVAAAMMMLLISPSSSGRRALLLSRRHSETLLKVVSKSLLTEDWPLRYHRDGTLAFFHCHRFDLRPCKLVHPTVGVLGELVSTLVIYFAK